MMIKRNNLALACTVGLATLAAPTMAETTFKYGGFIKFDAIFSTFSDKTHTNNIGNDFVVPSTIDTGNGSAGGDVVFDAHAKHSRLNFTTMTDTDAGKVKSFIEMDFNSSTTDERLTNQSSNGLRHALFSLTKEDGSSILTGQTWSTFFNTGALPEAVDFVGPTSGSVFIRQAQVRYTMPIGKGKLLLSAENSSSGFYDAGIGAAGTVNDVEANSIPDLIARYDNKAGSLSYSAAVMLRQIAYSVDESENGFGVTFSGKYALDNGDDIKFMLSNGNLGRYIALNAYRDGGIKADGTIDLNTVTGGFVAYKHNWNEKLRSTAIYAFSEADNADGIANTVTKSANNININLMYSPAKKLTFGAEYLIAERELDNGDSGDLSRIQFTSKWAF